MDAVGSLWTVVEQNVRAFALFAGATKAFADCTTRLSIKQTIKYGEAFLETIIVVCVVDLSLSIEH